MSKFLQTKGKLIHVLVLILLIVVVFYALYYMTNFQYVYVVYGKTAGKLEIIKDDMFKSAGLDTKSLYSYFSSAKMGGSPVAEQLKSAKYAMPTSYTDVNTAGQMLIYNFQQDMNSFNNLIVVYALVCVACVAGLFVLGNQSRKIYYKSNLVGGIALPVVSLVFSVVMIIKQLDLISRLNKDLDFYKVVYAMMDPKTQLIDKRKFYSSTTEFTAKTGETYKNGWDAVQKNSESVNSTPMIVGVIIFAIIALVSVLLMAYAVYRYKASAKRRAEVIERAVAANDK